jgi:hypothetical protein
MPLSTNDEQPQAQDRERQGEEEQDRAHDRVQEAEHGARDEGGQGVVHPEAGQEVGDGQKRDGGG